jgi:hypothetical protein
LEYSPKNIDTRLFSRDHAIASNQLPFEHESITSEITQIIEGFLKVNDDDGMDAETGSAAFK